MREDVHDLLLELGKWIASKRLGEEVRQVVQRVYLGHRQRSIGLALTHHAFTPSVMWRVALEAMKLCTRVITFAASTLKMVGSSSCDNPISLR